MAAATTARRTTARKAAPAKPKSAPVEPEVAPEEDFDEELVEAEVDEDLEELEEDDVAETKPTKAKAADTVTFGIRDLVDLINRETGDTTDPRAVRTLIRKMARDESGRVQREITPGNRTRYDWSGPNDPEVLAILKAYKGGELEAEKQAKLKALKEQKAAKTAAKKRAAEEVEEVEEDEDEAPAKPVRRVAKKTAAKPTATRRRKAPEPEVVEDDEELDFDDEE